MIQYQPSLVDASLRTIERGQTRHGAYLAAPTFPTYRYSWFRDGAFIARAMDAWERHDSASAFHTWALRTLDRECRASGRLQRAHPCRRTAAPHPLRPGRECRTRRLAQLPAGRAGHLAAGLPRSRGPPRNHAERSGPSDDGATGGAWAAWPQPRLDCSEEHGDRLHRPPWARSQQDPCRGRPPAGSVPRRRRDMIASYVLTPGVSDVTSSSTSVDLRRREPAVAVHG